MKRHYNRFALERNLHSAVSKKKYSFYLVLYLFCFLSYYLYTNPEWSDVTRNISIINNTVIEYHSLSDVVINSLRSQLDFLFPVINWFFVSILGIDTNVILSLILFFFFYIICEFLRKDYYLWKENGVILLYVLFSCPFVFIHGISRNLLTISFLYLGLHQYLKRNMKWCVFFMCLSFITHVTILLYIAIFLISVFLSKHDFSQKKVRIVLFTCLLVSVLFPKLLIGLISIISQYAADNNERFTYYTWVYTEQATENLFNTGKLNYAIKIPIFFTFFYSIVLLFLETRKDPVYWMLYITVILFSFFSQCTVTLAERCLMGFPLLVGCSIFSIHNRSTYNKKQIVTILSYIGLLTVALHMISISRYFALPF